VVGYGRGRGAALGPAARAAAVATRAAAAAWATLVRAAPEGVCSTGVCPPELWCADDHSVGLCSWENRERGGDRTV